VFNKAASAPFEGLKQKKNMVIFASLQVSAIILILSLHLKSQSQARAIFSSFFDSSPKAREAYL